MNNQILKLKAMIGAGEKPIIRFNEVAGTICHRWENGMVGYAVAMEEVVNGTFTIAVEEREFKKYNAALEKELWLGNDEKMLTFSQKHPDWNGTETIVGYLDEEKDPATFEILEETLPTGIVELLNILATGEIPRVRFTEAIEQTHTCWSEGMTGYITGATLNEHKGVNSYALDFEPREYAEYNASLEVPAMFVVETDAGHEEKLMTFSQRHPEWTGSGTVDSELEGGIMVPIIKLVRYGAEPLLYEGSSLPRSHGWSRY